VMQKLYRYGKGETFPCKVSTLDINLNSLGSPVTHLLAHPFILFNEELQR
jgi:hypothetical protein